jgi:hypothetical protein
MKFNQLTHNISLGILVIAAIYTLVYSGLTGVLMVSAVGLLTAAFIDEMELIVAVTVLFAMFYTLYMKRQIQQYEPYVDDDNFKDAEDDDHFEPQGVYDSKIEGFANASTPGPTPVPGAAPPAPAAPAAPTAPPAPAPAPAPAAPAAPAAQGQGQPSTSTAAPAAPAAPVVGGNSNAGTIANTVASALSSMGAATGAKAGFANQDEFQSATGSLFKLGKMPSEHAEGPRLDAGQTIMKAMSSFDPKTISAMTTDTKKLLETQKGLMQMLTQMRPVLADGKELLNTFTGMFGGGAPGM